MKSGFDHILPFSGDCINVIIETPKGSQNKFDFAAEQGIFKLSKSLPMGTVFPFDFGFIPGTKGADGDPLDVLVLMDQPAYPGVWIECRLLGVLKAVQKEKGGKKERNDRYIAVSDTSIMFKDIREIKMLNAGMVKEIENFFIDYNKHEHKKCTPKSWHSKKTALKLTRKQIHN